MVMTRNQVAKVLGQEGEDLAVQFLKKKGFQILEKNYRCRLGEIDIIVEDKNRLVFVEVKTRRNSEAVSPRELISRSKQIHISKVAQHYLSQKKNRKREITASFAVLIVDWSLGNHKRQRRVEGEAPSGLPVEGATQVPIIDFIDHAFDLGWGY